MFLPEGPGLPERVVLTLDLRQGLEEVPPSDPLAFFRRADRLTLGETILTLDRAAEDERVAGLVARFDGGGPGLAQAQDLKAAIARFREQGKFAYAYADSFGEFGPGTRGYYLATACDEIYLQPLGALGLTGIMIETPLLRGLLDKLGVRPSGDKRGPYKTAANLFTESTLTPEHRESLESIAQSLEQQIVEGLMADRGFDAETIGRLIDGGPYSAAEAAELGLVDALGYWDEVVARSERESGEQGELITLGRYAQMLQPIADDAPVIGLIHGVGQIKRGDSDSGPAGWVMGGDTVAAAFTDAIEDDEVDAILFRIDSGGGSAVASETIGRQIRRAVEAGTPVIVSMGEVAASGGYWIAMDASTIVAASGTLTGSIGVLAGKPVLDELWREVGIGWGRVERGANAAMWSTSVDYSPRGRARLEAFLDNTYQAFTEGVARGRGLSQAEVLAVAEGRVWTGAQAKEFGLIDELGGFARALTLAKEAAGMAADQPVRLRRFPEPRPPWEQALQFLEGPMVALSEFRPWLAMLTSGVLSTPPLKVQ